MTKYLLRNMSQLSLLISKIYNICNNIRVILDYCKKLSDVLKLQHLPKLAFHL